jgi:hypothetical protein
VSGFFTHLIIGVGGVVRVVSRGGRDSGGGRGNGSLSNGGGRRSGV